MTCGSTVPWQNQEAALLFLVDIFEELLNKELPEAAGTAPDHLFKYIDKLVEEDDYPDAVVQMPGLDNQRHGGQRNDHLRTGYLKMYLKAAPFPN